MKKLSDFTDQQYAEKLGVSIRRIDSLRKYVHRHFFIEIYSNPPHRYNKRETFSAHLKILNDYETCLGLITFCTKDGKFKFNSPEKALKVALRNIRNVEFEKAEARRIGNIPPNILLLFDTEEEERRILRKLNADKYGQTH